MDDRRFRNAMGMFATGISVITTTLDDDVHGMTANAFMSVSLNPKLVLVSIGEHAKMHHYVQTTGKYAVSFLAEDQREISMTFAGQMDGQRSVAFDWFNGLPVIRDALAAISCDVVDAHKAGDHTLFIAEVSDVRLAAGQPLLFYQGKYSRAHAFA
ncbi:flavin reductase family protein [Alicyclobacillus acidoterrestris]|uniref:flavin reductase family protein n=1 Tax=Alicyclobacillus TaxID=29330 RepID=UPI0011961689|nr:flavin reductase family protein [Alicyclobacillus suci]GEO27735.1 flavin oxidoreductase [Alicyclobacillus acidoterrestris]